jgi:uncharacterized protein YcbX
MIIGTIKEIWRHPVKSMAGEQLDACVVDSLGIPRDRGWALRDETTRAITNGKRIPRLMQLAASYREQPANGAVPHVSIEFPDGTTVESDDPNVNDRLSEVLGKTVTLWARQPATNKSFYRRREASARIVGPLMKIPGFRAMLPRWTKLPSLDKPLREVFSREPNEPLPDISTFPAELMEFSSPLGTFFDAFPIHILTTASLATMERFNPAAAWDVRRFRPNFFIESADPISGLTEAEYAGRILRIGLVELKCELPTVRCGMPTHAQRDLAKDPSVLRSIVKDADQKLGVYASVIRAGSVSKGDQVELL